MNPLYITTRHRLGKVAAAAMVTAVALMAGSCSDDPSLFATDGYVEAGLPATITLRWDVPEPAVQSRALTDAEASKVNDLWIGIYDADTRQLKNQFHFTKDHDDIHQSHPLNDLQTTSGKAYIVGVANSDTNYGYSSGDSGIERVTLRSLLEKADNLDKYLSIAAAISSTTQVEYISANLVMSGTYLENRGTSGVEHPDNPDWTKLPVVTIPAGTVNLNTGKLHLRRLVSQVSFNIKAGTGITVRPTRWRVVNNPRMSYLQEQGINAGDKFSNLLSDTDPNANYGNSDPETEIKLNADNSYSFDFYTFENRRTGLSDVCKEFEDREKEFKTSTGVAADNKEHFTNTGVYQSLCATDAKPNLLNGVNVNNFATLVEVECEVSYPVVNGNTTIQRSGTALYTIHLGYMNKDVTDFNVRRNYKYNYTMTVLGLNQIVLEAEGGEGDEKYTGLEGNVVDATSASVVLDAHYGMYNIQLSNYDRAHLRYIIEAPYGNTVKTVEGWGIRTGVDPSAEPAHNNEYYNWIRIKPAPAQDIFAEYKSSADDEPWYLHDLITQENGSLKNKGYGDTNGNITNTTQRWYTVFINENVYDVDGIDAHPLSDWVNYVNQEPRSVLFLVQDVQVSADSESRYTSGKYRLRQRSIQTYYTTDIAAYGGTAPTALGVEHVNESYGKKIDWRWAAGSTDATTNDSQLSLNNGRWNQWKFLVNATNSYATNPAGQAEATRPWRCNYTALNNANSRNSAYGLLRYVTAYGTTSTAATGYIQADQNGYPVPELASYTTASGTRTNDPNGQGGYYEALALCMSRNRDLDGDGRISPDEVRWYLPAEGKYERIMLGRNSLTTPMFSVAAGAYYCNSNDPIAVDNSNFGYTGTTYTNGQNNELHFISSNHMKFYADEGGSYHRNLNVYWNQWGTEAYGMYPWNIRCVRNLGTDLSTVNTEMDHDPLEKAYTATKNADGYTEFTQRYYYGRSLRPLLINDYIPVHTLSDMEKNRIPYKFEVYGEDTAITIPYTITTATGTTTYYSTFKDALDDNLPCKSLTKEGDTKVWRVPNQRELMMIMNEGLLKDHDVFSCTQDAYPANGRFARANVGLQQVEMRPAPTGTVYVRCIRDVE